MKGRLVGAVGTNASKMVPEIWGRHILKGDSAAAAVTMAMGATDARLGALAANGRPSQTPATGTEMTDWVTLASWKCAGN